MTPPPAPEIEDRAFLHRPLSAARALAVTVAILGYLLVVLPRYMHSEALPLHLGCAAIFVFLVAGPREWRRFSLRGLLAAVVVLALLVAGRPPSNRCGNVFMTLFGYDSLASVRAVHEREQRYTAIAEEARAHVLRLAPGIE
ncbi:MAG: hypothetical protein HZA54_20850 [Planctomycetes bacterium]|nr:hypothetical protein [Planctomycetota bacterium]